MVLDNFNRKPDFNSKIMVLADFDMENSILTIE